MSVQRISLEFDDVDLLDTRQFPLRDESDSIRKLERAVRSRHQRYVASGGRKRFVVKSIPVHQMVVIWRVE